MPQYRAEALRCLVHMVLDRWTAYGLDPAILRENCRDVVSLEVA